LNKKFFLIFVILFLFILTSCKENENNEQNSPHKCTIENATWVYPTEVKCLDNTVVNLKCNECGDVLDTKEEKKPHNKVTDEKEPTCGEPGYLLDYCTDCDYRFELVLEATSDHELYYEIINKATDDHYGLKKQHCKNCNLDGAMIRYVNNGYSDHGKLSVVGPDLVDANGEKFQLIGISTHGLQWFGQYVNYVTIDALHNEFGINVLRLSLTTAEGGYCEVEGEKREYLYQLVAKGIRIATALDMYVIVDWHMVGANDVKDKNPLYYVKESMEFFSRISEEFKDYDNVLYEIMNEPNGSTTWADCKKYANSVIPCIRENTDGIVLVGNPRWTADLNSVMKSPLEGYDNIMYTYHFYAADHSNTSQVSTAYDNGFPVFISEHGAMNSDGDGKMNATRVENWYKVLDARNISYVAWNLSNSKGSASILKHGITDMANFSDDALKTWGVWYKAWVRKKFNFPGQAS
jgi:endoglucanase